MKQWDGYLTIFNPADALLRTLSDVCVGWDADVAIMEL